MVSMVWSWHPFLSLILFGLPKASLNTRSPATSASPRKCHSKTSHNHIQPAPKPSAHLMDLPQFLGHLLILSNFHRETWSARKSKFQLEENIWHRIMWSSFQRTRRSSVLWRPGFADLQFWKRQHDARIDGVSLVFRQSTVSVSVKWYHRLKSTNQQVFSFQSFAGLNDEWDGVNNYQIKYRTTSTVDSLDPLSIWLNVQHLSTMFEP